MAVTLLGEFEIRRKISLIADSSRVSRTTSVSWPEAEELLWRTAFRVFALRLRPVATLLLALERRRIAHPKGLGLRRFSKWHYSRDLRSAKWVSKAILRSAILSLVAASTMTVLRTVSSRAFSIQQTCGRRGDQVWSQWSRVPQRGRSGLPRMR